MVECWTTIYKIFKWFRQFPFFSEKMGMGGGLLVDFRCFSEKGVKWAFAIFWLMNDCGCGGRVKTHPCLVKIGKFPKALSDFASGTEYSKSNSMWVLTIFAIRLILSVKLLKVAMENHIIYWLVFVRNLDLPIAVALQIHTFSEIRTE